MGEVELVKVDCDWKLAKNECRTTVNKEFTEAEPKSKFIQDLLISEHSPIRLIRILYRFRSIKYWITTHFVRHHEGVEKWVGTQRTDRTGVDRDELTQDNLVNMDMEANAQGLINMSRVRLCNQASRETRDYMRKLRSKIKEVQPELAHVMVPNCVYRCGCPEFKECGYFTRFKNWAESNGYDMNEIRDRYEAYEEYEWKMD